VATYPDIPEAIQSERLVIRCPKLEDVPELYASVRESLLELIPWMPWASADYSYQECEENTRSAIARFITRADLRYHAHGKATGEHIVSSGLHRIDWRVPRFEIGYWCRSSKTGQGYVSETVRALTRLAFGCLNAARVELRCDDLNAGSARVAERCGFGLEATLKNHHRSTNGELRAERIYALTELADLR
jgi:RimJ/RimL family protein N-acetyltransferase